VNEAKTWTSGVNRKKSASAVTPKAPNGSEQHLRTKNQRSEVGPNSGRRGSKKPKRKEEGVQTRERVTQGESDALGSIAASHPT